MTCSFISMQRLLTLHTVFSRCVCVCVKQMMYFGKPLWLVFPHLSGQIAEMKSQCCSAALSGLSASSDPTGLILFISDTSILWIVVFLLMIVQQRNIASHTNKQTDTCDVDPLPVWTGTDVENTKMITVKFRKRMIWFLKALYLVPSCFCIIDFPQRISMPSLIKWRSFLFRAVCLCASFVPLHGRQCLHWQYDWNKHIKPRWALLSKQSLRSSGWHGHSKYSRSTSAQLC